MGVQFRDLDRVRQDEHRRHQRDHLTQAAQPQLLTLRSKTTALVIIEPRKSPAIEFLKHPNLFVRKLKLR